MRRKRIRYWKLGRWDFVADLYGIRFVERLRKVEEAEEDETVCYASAFGWSFVRDPCNFLPAGESYR